MTRLSVSIVTYAPDLTGLSATITCLGEALQHAQRQGVLAAASLIVVDNGPGQEWQSRLQTMLASSDLPATVELISGQGNVGYGGGHNLALQQARSDYHLILNPDVLMEPATLSTGLTFLAAHPEAGLLAPAVADAAGQRQYLCRRYPSVLDLVLRGFAPAWLKRRFRQRLDRYELRDCIGDAPYWDPPLVSGCFMLARRTSLQQVGGFDPGYFLYFEDYDLSLRIARCTRLVYVPTLRITHLGGYAARKGWRHLGLFGRAALRFFNRYGWRWR